MKGSVEERLSVLAKVAKDLNTASDEFSERLRSIESRLNALNLGVQVLAKDPFTECIIEPDPETEECPSGYVRFLGYEKHGDSWRIVVKEQDLSWGVTADMFDRSNPDKVSAWHVTPLLDCSRDIRLEAVRRIGELLEEIEQAAQKRLALLREGMACVPVDGAVPGSSADPTAENPRHVARTARSK